jgi:hypothetical protein
MIIYNDNLQIIRLLISKIVKMNIKLRHVDIAQFWLRQSVQQEKIDVNYLLTAHIMIDEMIKLLFSQRHKQFIQQLRMMNVKCLMNKEISWFKISARNFALSSIELFFSRKKFNLTDYFNDYFNR